MVSSHDPLCPMTLARYISGTGFMPTCQCDLIVAVGERIAQAIEAEARRIGLGDDVSGLELAAGIARNGGSDG